MLAQYKKFVAAIVATVAVALAGALGDDVFTVAEQINVLIVFLGAISVLGAGNLPAGVWAYTKGYVAAASAIAVFISNSLIDGVSTSEWIQAGLAGLGAVGVVAVGGPLVSAVRGHHQV